MGHTVNKSKGEIPVVLSKNKFEGIISRSRQQQKLDQIAAMEEEQRYKQYLKDGNEALVSCFTNYASVDDRGDDELQAARDTILAEKAKDQRTLELLRSVRKESLLHANRIMYLLKPGPNTLHSALLTSHMIHQQRANAALKKEIAKDAQRQQRNDEQLCPNWLIPTGYVTEAEEKAKQKEVSLQLAQDYKRDLAERRERRLAEKEQETCDTIIEREQYRCLQEVEEKKAKELAQKKRDFYRRSYHESVREKAARAECKCQLRLCFLPACLSLVSITAEKIQAAIDDRINCVGLVTSRNLSARYNKQLKNMREEQIQRKEVTARRVYKLQQAKQQEQNTLEENAVEKYEFEVMADEARRQCQVQELGKQRRAYQQEELDRNKAKDLQKAEVRRFEIATRYRNAKVNKAFFDREKQVKSKVLSTRRTFLSGQRDEFLQKRETELMRMTACQEDPYLQDDVDFFQGAVDFMQEAKRLGMPLYPMVKAAEDYKRENQLDMMPEGLMMRRNTKRDTCWPGYFSKARLAFRKYEHRENCRQEMEAKRHNIFNNCIKIQSMAAKENPEKPCVPGGIIKCMRFKGVPGGGSEASLEFPIELFMNKTQSKESSKEPSKEPSKESSIESVERPMPAPVRETPPCVKYATRTATNPAKQPSLESCNRCTGGRNALPTSSRTSPDLTRFWTTKPQATRRSNPAPATPVNRAPVQSPKSIRNRKQIG